MAEEPITGQAWFVQRPGAIYELIRPHRPEEEYPFEVVRRIVLPGIEYENFITDLYADRQFIEDNAALCSKGAVFRCLLVQRRGKRDGVLVLPWEECFVGRAAYYCPDPAEAYMY